MAADDVYLLRPLNTAEPTAEDKRHSQELHEVGCSLRQMACIIVDRAALRKQHNQSICNLRLAPPPPPPPTRARGMLVPACPVPPVPSSLFPRTCLSPMTRRFCARRCSASSTRSRRRGFVA